MWKGSRSTVVEVKKAMVTKDMAQLAQYMCALGSKGEYIASNMCIGFLLDEHHFRVAFAPFSLNDNLLLPIVLFSPVLKWREDNSICRGVCVAMCLLQRLWLKRVTVTPNDLEGLVGQGLKDGVIINKDKEWMVLRHRPCVIYRLFASWSGSIT